MDSDRDPRDMASRAIVGAFEDVLKNGGPRTPDLEGSAVKLVPEMALGYPRRVESRATPG